MHRLEHANLTVADPDATARFIRTAFPEFSIRGRGTKQSGLGWLHIGTDNNYLAIEQAADGALERAPYSPRPGFNHLGWEVDDLDALVARMAAGGFQPNLESTDHPARHRVYFHDPDGNDWEFIQYNTDNPAQRHDYSR